MQEETLSDTRRKALLELLDDPHPVVRKELLREFSRLGSAGFDFLAELASGYNRLRRRHAEWFLTELRHSNPIEEFRSFIQSQRYELESGYLLICRVAYPDLDVGEFCLSLDAMAQRCKDLMVEPMTAKETCRVINRVLFHERGFRGNNEDYTDPDNSFLNRVMETRKGLPIALSALYALIAQRLGLSLEGVGLPGHFMLTCRQDSAPFFVDPYDRGRFSSAMQLMEKLGKAQLAIDKRLLGPVPVREFLCRACRNLVNHYRMAGLSRMADIFESFVEAFDEAYHQRASR